MMLGSYGSSKIQDIQDEDVSYKEFDSAAVVCNNSISCTVGKNILKEGGSVVDAAIASMLTLGVISFQSAGIGGGLVMVYFDQKSGKQYSIDSRSTIPLGLKDGEFYVEDDYRRTYGRSAIAVPGEIRGFWKAHQMFGKLPWPKLFEPAIKVAENGFKMTSSTENWTNVMIDKVEGNDCLRQFLTHPDGTLKKTGDIIVRTNLAKTLRTIANEGADAFYNGSLTESILKDIHGGFGEPSVITEDDLIQYKVKLGSAIKFPLDDDVMLVSTGAPTGGPVLAFLLNILKGYKFSTEDLKENKILAFHRIVEAMKFAYSRKKNLGDPEFNGQKVHELIKEMLSEEFGEKIRSQIDDYGTHAQEYYGDILTLPKEYGTGFLGIVGEDGSAVSMTSTINRAFGSQVYGERTGIIFNDQMVGFTTPDSEISMQSLNLMEPGKRANTGITPVLLLRKNIKGNQEIEMVIGGSGGTIIINAIAWPLMQYLWFNQNIDNAIRSTRMHHACQKENLLHLEFGFDKEIKKGLAERGHIIDMIPKYRSNVHAIVRLKNGKLGAKVDERRGGSPDGY